MPGLRGGVSTSGPARHSTTSNTPTDIVLLAVLWRLRYTRSFRDVAELLLERGYAVTHETIATGSSASRRSWRTGCEPKRRGRAGVSWYIDETDVKVAGRWCYLYRAIDREGALIDSMLSAHRDKHAARRFLRGLLQVAERKPLRITTDAHPAYRKAIRWIVGRKVQHRCNRYLNNRIEQDSPGHQAALLPDAGVRKLRGRWPVLPRLRCATAVLPCPTSAWPADLVGRATPAVRDRWRSLIQEMQVAEDTRTARGITTPRRLCCLRSDRAVPTQGRRSCGRGDESALLK